jgi:hypothetical protein
MESLLSYFRGSVVLHTLEHSRTDQIKRIISQLQPASQALAASVSLNYLANNAWLAAAG